MRLHIKNRNIKMLPVAVFCGFLLHRFHKQKKSTPKRPASWI